MGRVVATAIPSNIVWRVTKEKNNGTEKVITNRKIEFIYKFSEVEIVDITKFDHFCGKDIHGFISLLQKNCDCSWRQKVQKYYSFNIVSLGDGALDQCINYTQYLLYYGLKTRYDHYLAYQVQIYTKNGGLQNSSLRGR